MANSITYTPQAIDLAGLKSFCRVDGSDDDNLLTFLYEAACEEALSYAHVVVGSANITSDTVWGSSYELPYWPLGSVTSVTVYVEGVATVDTEYEILDGVISPSIGEEGDRMVIVYTAGYAAAPKDLIHAIYQRVKFGYDFGDDMPYNVGPRFFDRIVFRYRRNFA
jgi:hypothetical protein